MKGPITARQAEVLATITTLYRRGYPATIRELCAALEISSPNGVGHHLAVLERRGLISREPGSARTLRPSRPGGRRARATAGSLHEAAGDEGAK